MTVKERINKYFKKKSKFAIISDFLFAALIIAVIIPSSRMQLMAFVNKVKIAIVQPDIKNSEDAKRLVKADYNWNLISHENKKVNLSDYKDKIIFLNIWATWCPPCVAEMPSIQKLYDRYKDNKKIEFVILSSEKLPKIQAFLKKHNYTFPVFTTENPAPKPFYTKSIPVTFVISKNGEIVIHEIGASNWNGEKVVNLINKLLKNE